MKNLLNAVSIEKTIRVKASTEIEAIQIAFGEKHSVVCPVSCEDSVFMGYDNSERDTQFIEVAYVEKTANGFRVEIGNVYVNELELSFLIDQEKEVYGYVDLEDKKFVSEEYHALKLNYWFDVDAKAGEVGRMYGHVDNSFVKAVFKNGEVKTGE